MAHCYDLWSLLRLVGNSWITFGALFALNALRSGGGGPVVPVVPVVPVRLLVLLVPLVPVHQGDLLVLADLVDPQNNLPAGMLKPQELLMKTAFTPPNIKGQKRGHSHIL